ncbi:chemotaxis protein CheA [Azospirillum sp. A26]|uniref:chemotaxis protein CheA n=1 Tax=Azospirillum sp. A26 TaxID=3160607 RepID=UPI00366CB81D
MSELFDQFVVEAQELLETAGGALLALERDPADRASVDELFRAFHTLKGASGLFDMAAFTRLVHAGEDTLSLLRDGRRSMTPELADRLFRALDQCARWVAALEDSGALPADAAQAADTLVRGLSGVSAEGAAGGGEAAGEADAFPWVAALAGEDRDAAGMAGDVLTAIDYRPDPDCFFTGDDPLALFRRVPDLRWLRIEPAEPLPPLAQMDPDRCLLRFRALSGAAVEAVTPAFRSVPDQVRIGSVTLAPAVVPAALSAKPITMAPPGSLAVAMLEEQARILDLPGNAAECQSRSAAVARAVVAILTALGRPADRAVVAAACADAGTLRRFLADGPPENGPPEKPAAAEARPASPRRALRVEPERMDALMALVGELSVVKGQLGPLVRRVGDGELTRDMKAFSARLDSLVDDLRHAALRLRLLPLARVFDPLPRLVRDTARRLDKTVELVLDGAETEADKDILDVLGEPLLHLVRNALDHGIEAPERRAALGKPPGGTLRVRGFQDKGGVVVEVSDDGAGIDPAAMRKAAVAKGLLAPDAAAALGDDEAVRLVFAPGFSTAGSVSDLSGRGVGMDAVRAAVERAGGRVEIASTPGSGTRVRLSLPLTLSITRVVVVEAAGSFYGIPVAVVGGVQRVPRTEIRGVKRAESIVLRDRVVPLVRLRRLLGQPPDDGGEHRSGHGGGHRGEADCVVLAELGDGPVAVAVDDVGERADVVLRPMTGVLRGLRGYAGTAVLGDGRLILVLDLRELL